ncbi:hypothetical protein EZS27_026442 [termite gut metagenome]|uniref:Glycoside hydrolase family 5 domain-containing protein n=1 Tax=termite gut metagenome TaxID=433724 RepID=A0A5J4QUE6_9ZZZZ
MPFFWVRGFNYQPGYDDGTGGYGDGTSWSIWKNFKIDVIERELSRGVELFPEMTALRIWLPYQAYLSQPKQFLKDFSKFIQVIGKLKLRTMIVLFNAWHGNPFFGGFRPESFKSLSLEDLKRTFRFADDLLDRHSGDERIFAWDLCNEPSQLDIYLPWLQGLHDHIRSRREKNCLTIGVDATQTSVEVTKCVEPLCDIISEHPYLIFNNAPAERYRNNFDDLIRYVNETDKSLLVTETGWGDLSDSKRVESLHIELSNCVEHKAGFLIHALNHSLVSDLHRPEYGPVGGAGYMACIEKNGSLRPGHEMIRDYLKAK